MTDFDGIQITRRRNYVVSIGYFVDVRSTTANERVIAGAARNNVIARIANDPVITALANKFIST